MSGRMQRGIRMRLRMLRSSGARSCMFRRSRNHHNQQAPRVQLVGPCGPQPSRRVRRTLEPTDFLYSQSSHPPSADGDAAIARLRIGTATRQKDNTNMPAGEPDRL